MSYNNPSILSIPAPRGLDLVIESIRTVLDTYLLWLDKSYGRAWEFKEKGVEDKVSKIPKAYMGEGEYLPVLPNDFLVAQSFIAAKGPEQWEQFNRIEGSIKKRDLAIIFWVNLKQIDPTKDYIFTEELKAEIEDLLKRHPSVLSLNNYYDEIAEDVFQGYDIDDVDTQYLMYPYAGMRFDLTIIYDEACGISPDITYAYNPNANADIEFIVGTEGYDLEGETTYQNDLLKGYRVRLFRNTVKQSKLATPGGYAFSQSEEDIAEGRFTVTPAFIDEEVISIEKY